MTPAPTSDQQYRPALALAQPACDLLEDADSLRNADVLRNAELVQLRVRVVALENLVIALLAATPVPQTLARDMAQYISPRPGHTDHPLTTHAATLMNHLIDRAAWFRTTFRVTQPTHPAE